MLHVDAAQFGHDDLQNGEIPIREFLWFSIPCGFRVREISNPCSPRKNSLLLGLGSCRSKSLIYRRRHCSAMTVFSAKVTFPSISQPSVRQEPRLLDD
jgi:hypothetical protein